MTGCDASTPPDNEDDANMLQLGEQDPAGVSAGGRDQVCAGSDRAGAG